MEKSNKQQKIDRERERDSGKRNVDEKGSQEKRLSIWVGNLQKLWNSMENPKK